MATCRAHVAGQQQRRRRGVRIPLQGGAPGVGAGVHGPETGRRKEPSQTFAVSALRHSTELKPVSDYPLKWPRISSETRANQWLTDGLQSKCGSTIIADSDRMLECVNSVCNHVTYSYVC